MCNTSGLCSLKFARIGSFELRVVGLGSALTILAV